MFTMRKGGMGEGMRMQHVLLQEKSLLSKLKALRRERPFKVIRDATQLFLKWSVSKYIFLILHALLNK